jgi:two-component system LytT family response regulator
MNENTKIALQSTDGLILIQKEEILYALAGGNYPHIHLTKNRTVKVLKKLKQVTKLLSDENFIRIHRSHLVNMKHVMRFKEGKTVVMSDEHCLLVARSYKAEFSQRFIRI